MLLKVVIVFLYLALVVCKPAGRHSAHHLHSRKHTETCNTTMHQCRQSPCFFATCDSKPNARCRDSYCGGCFANFYDKKGNMIPECSNTAG